VLLRGRKEITFCPTQGKKIDMFFSECRFCDHPGEKVDHTVWFMYMNFLVNKRPMSQALSNYEDKMFIGLTLCNDNNSIQSTKLADNCLEFLKKYYTGVSKNEEL
jgi:hypothetical protein